MAAGGTRQRMTLSDQLSLLQPTNLRDLLKLRDEDIFPGRSPSVTLAAALSSEKTSTSSAVASGSGGGGSRTLLEVIREDDEESRVSGGSFSWRNLTDRLRISHAAAAAALAAGSPSSSNPTTEGALSDRVTTIRVSLMTLMEIREREEEEMTGARATADDDVASEEEEDDVAEVAKRHVCCVCMVRKKGAAFIPCGHTFCRVCSRELFLDRGNCPLCNGTISEVLDIY